MVNRRLILSFCLTGILLLNARSATAQQPQPKPLPANPVIANPVDPASLNAPPAFGDSAPVEKKPIEPPTSELAPLESSPVAETEWKPKLRVVLVTQTGTPDAPVRFHSAEKSQRHFSGDLDLFPNDVKPTASRNVAPAQPFALLMCDRVTVDAKSSQTGDLTYSVSCKGKVSMKIDGYTVSGDSMSSDEGKLTITNAVVKSNKATLTAEKMQIQLPIFGVRVEPDAAEPKGSSDSLEQTPDAFVAPHAFAP